MRARPVLLVTALLAAFAAQAQQPDVVRIGHVSPTTGSIGHLGKDAENGAQLAVDELNAQGVVIGGKKVTLELMKEDDAADPKQGTAAAQKLVDAKVNGVVGHVNSGTTIPASKIYSDAGIPQISPSATNPKYTQQGFKTTFRVCANDAQLGGTLGKYAVATLKAKTVVVMDDATAYGTGVAEEFRKGATKAGAKVVGIEHTNDKATDFASILTNIKSKKPDVIFFGGNDAQAGPMLRQMKQLGIAAKYMGGDGICTSELPNLAGEALGNDLVYCAEAGGVLKGKEAPLEAFKQRYKAKYGIDVQIFAPYSYDAVMVMVDAMKKAGSAEPAKYLPVLAKEDYTGVMGEIAFDAHGDMKHGTLTLHTFRDGKKQDVAVIQP